MREVKEDAVQGSLFDADGEGEKARMYPQQPSRFDVAEALARPEGTEETKAGTPK